MLSQINFNLFFTIVTAAVTAFLGALVFIHDRKNTSNKIFILHSIIGTIWAVINYFSVTDLGPTALFLIRLVLFFAVPYVCLFLLFVWNFPSSKLLIPKNALVTILTLMLLMMALTQTQLVFSKIKIINETVVPVPGFLMPFFAILLVSFFILSLVLVVKKYITSDKEFKNQWFSIGFGLAAAYLMLICFVFLPVTFFNNITFVAYSPIFILPIFIGTAYAILKHHLFNVKVIASESITFALLLITFVEIFIAPNQVGKILGVFSTIGVFIFGALLIRSVLREVTQREQLEKLTNELTDANQKLLALDQARAEFISIASHQLRTPPATVKWYLSAIIAGDYGPLDPQVKETLQRAERTNTLLISLIEDILNVSRIERGKLEFLFESVDMENMARVTFEQLQPLAQQKQQKLSYTPPQFPLPKIMADKEKLRQVMNNLIDNAIKYTPSAGKIDIKLEKVGDLIKFSVTDNGKGLDDDDKKTIFEKYTRGKESIKHSAGLGLGLYVAKIIVGQHKGQIWATSPGAGQGSTFSFSIPIHNDLQASSIDFTK